MKIYKVLPIAVLPIVTALAIGVYFYGSQLNEVLKITYGANVLLIILIVVDGSGGVLAPFLYIDLRKKTVKKKRNSCVGRTNTKQDTDKSYCMVTD